MDKPQIILHVQKPINYTLYDTRWIPNSAKFVVVGSYARGTGAIQIYEVSRGEIVLVHEVRNVPVASFFYLKTTWATAPNK